MTKLADKIKVGNKEYSVSEITMVRVMALTLLQGKAELLTPDQKTKWYSYPLEVRLACVKYAKEALDDTLESKARHLGSEGESHD